MLYVLVNILTTGLETILPLFLYEVEKEVNALKINRVILLLTVSGLTSRQATEEME